MKKKAVYLGRQNSGGVISLGFVSLGHNSREELCLAYCLPLRESSQVKTYPANPSNPLAPKRIFSLDCPPEIFYYTHFNDPRLKGQQSNLPLVAKDLAKRCIYEAKSRFKEVSTVNFFFDGALDNCELSFLKEDLVNLLGGSLRLGEIKGFKKNGHDIMADNVNCRPQSVKIKTSLQVSLEGSSKLYSRGKFVKMPSVLYLAVLAAHDEYDCYRRLNHFAKSRRNIHIHVETLLKSKSFIECCQERDGDWPKSSRSPVYRQQDGYGIKNGWH